MTLVESIPRILKLKEDLLFAIREHEDTETVSDVEKAAALMLIVKELSGLNMDTVNRLVDAVELEADLNAERTRPRPTSNHQAKNAFTSAAESKVPQIMDLVNKVRAAQGGTLLTTSKGMDALKTSHPELHEKLMKTATKVHTLADGLNKLDRK